MTQEPAHARASIVNRGAGRTIAAGPVRIEYKLDAGAQAGWSMIEYEVPAGFKAPPVVHWHTREQAFFYVLSGCLEFDLDAGPVRAGEGAFVRLPAHAAFRWSNPSDAAARFLCMYAPGGFEEFHADVAAALAAAGVAVPTPQAMRKVVPALWDKYGIEAAAP